VTTGHLAVADDLLAGVLEHHGGVAVALVGSGYASSNGAASVPLPIDGQSHTRPARPATRRLYGCARDGCLEIAKPGAHHCPLHD
jgi:hypothetical protein